MVSANTAASFPAALPDRVASFVPAELQGLVRFEQNAGGVVTFRASSSAALYMMAGELRGGLEDQITAETGSRRCRVKLAGRR